MGLFPVVFSLLGLHRNEREETREDEKTKQEAGSRAVKMSKGHFIAEIGQQSTIRLFAFK